VKQGHRVAMPGNYFFNRAFFGEVQSFVINIIAFRWPHVSLTLFFQRNFCVLLSVRLNNEVKL